MAPLRPCAVWVRPDVDGLDELGTGFNRTRAGSIRELACVDDLLRRSVVASANCVGDLRTNVGVVSV